MLLKAIRGAASKARKDSALLPSFRALRLNQGVSDYQRASLLSAGVWESIEGDAPAVAALRVGNRPRHDSGNVGAGGVLAGHWTP